MRCAQCGSELLPEDAFCVECGTPVAPAPQTTVSEAAPVLTEPVIEPPVVPVPPVPQPVPPVAAPAAPAKPKKEKKKRRGWNPSPPVKILLRIASVLLSLCLSLALLVTVLVLDVQRLTNQDNVQKVLDQIVLEESRPGDLPLTLARKAVNRNGSGSDETRDQLISWLYDVLKETGGEKMTVTEEQMVQFLERSTADEYLTEKTSGFISDFINGTEETKVRKTDVIKLMEENEEIIEDVFGAKLDDKMKQDVMQFMEENDVETVIHDEVFKSLEETAIVGSGRGAYTVGDLMETLRSLTAPSTLLTLILVDLLLIGLMLVTHWFRLGATMRAVGICMTSIGATLSVPTLLLQLVPSILSSLGSQLVSGILSTLLSVIAPVHYILFGLGVVMIISSIVVSITTSLPRK